MSDGPIIDAGALQDAGGADYTNFADQQRLMCFALAEDMVMRMALGADAQFDVLVIGGGINGCGVARDAVGRGYSVCLCEAGDLASGTSSAATKLIHGGLRYLEYYEFGLVREALMEREVLWQMAPHIIWPLRFVLPYQNGLRPRWLLRLGLFLYDYIGGRKLLPATKTLNLRTDVAGSALNEKFQTGFEYSDCWVMDSRLVVLSAKDAANRGADVRTRTKGTRAERDADGWTVEVTDQRSGVTEILHAKILVNAAGPWVDTVLLEVLGQPEVDNVRQVKGSHIVIKKKFAHGKCYILQNPDGRVIFAIPYEDEFTLIGTTDVEYPDMTGRPEATDAEIDYLCKMASDYFAEPVRREDVVWTYSGVRPLYNDGATTAQETTREYVIKTEGEGVGMLVNVFGGKLTTYRRLAETILDEIETALGPRHPTWTAQSRLPGGDFPVQGFEQLLADLQGTYPFVAPNVMRRLVRHYGTCIEQMLGDAKSIADLGQHFGAGLYAAEVDYLMGEEWAATAEDVLYRRTRMGLHLSAAEAEALDAYMTSSNAE